jgi:type II secretion system protein G
MTTPSAPRPVRAFTLIELLIVVAIIAILAAIAVPNFLEAQVRSKVSRAKADIRTIATALESYAVDYNKYPPTPFWGSSGVLRVIPNQLSTPVAYITTANFQDVFLDNTIDAFEYPSPSYWCNGNTGALAVSWSPCTGSGCSVYEPQDPTAGHRYFYQSNIDPRRSPGTQAALLEFSVPSQGAWIMASLGPDRVRNAALAGTSCEINPNVDVYMPYDPTNGTVSDGDIIRTQKEAEGSINP